MASILMGVIPIIFAFAQELRTTVHAKMVIWLATSSFISYASFFVFKITNKGWLNNYAYVCRWIGALGIWSFHLWVIAMAFDSLWTFRFFRTSTDSDKRFSVSRNVILSLIVVLIWTFYESAEPEGAM
jgi:hypothetical protein